MKGVNLVGWPFLKAGIGEHFRNVASGFDSADFDYSVTDTLEQCFNSTEFFKNDDFKLKSKSSNLNSFDINILNLNLNHLPRINKNIYNNKYNICYGYYELSELLEQFADYESYIDEYWAPTAFIQKVISRKLTVPVVHMPIPINITGPRKSIRKKLNLPEKAFLYLTSFDMRSLIERKNPHAAIDSYISAFKQVSANTGLVIKVSLKDGVASQVNEFLSLKEYAKGREDIHFITNIMEREEILDLINSCDSYISLHRAEGLGLGMAEAMGMGKPVIATAYSGNMEFMTSFNSCLVDYRLIKDPTHEKMLPNQDVVGDFFWADADIESASYLIRKVFIDNDFRLQISKSARNDILFNYSSEKIGFQYERRLDIIRRKILNNR
ncbi:hypothetical protein Q7A_1104 [Methylophaga nitratireducenticrescens]|uniref:Glycosyltransferase n=1 Tax=Methylophaga nitratireducenticrescens TaxID=754476 RepID=I1XHS5_METNJ|nr:glycosyltransferase family 4 protein [Methylophaga nitratireducenticrescens]AFI83944.1 hypothetical protein Q7A_1104 [Methylophaga nitratireducenticrescens]